MTGTGTPASDGEPADTRAIDLQVEVPGTPEQVWEAIATVPGITAWFVPASLARDAAGDPTALTFDFGDFGKQTSKVTAYEAPHRVVSESEMNGRTVALEFLVEGQAGGTSVVRLVNSGFGTEPEWDGEFRSMTAGWQLFLANLRLYLTHFPGQTASSILAHGSAQGAQEQAFQTLATALRIPPAEQGERIEIGGGDAPTLAGIVERRTPNLLSLRIDAPGPGIAFVYAEGWGETAMTSVYCYLYGEGADETTERERPGWQAWMGKHFPMPQG